MVSQQKKRVRKVTQVSGCGQQKMYLEVCVQDLLKMVILWFSDWVTRLWNGNRGACNGAIGTFGMGPGGRLEWEQMVWGYRYLWNGTRW